MAYQRFLSSIERYYVSCDSNIGKQHTPCLNQMVIEGQGNIDITQLEDAITRASLANIGSRLILKGHLGLSRWVDSGRTTPLSVIEDGKWDGYSDQAADFLHRPLPVRQGPTTEVILLKGSNKHHLIFRSHQGVMDSKGIQHFANDVFSILHGEKPLGENCHINDIQLAKSLNMRRKKVDLHDDVAAPTGIKTAITSNKTSSWVRKTLEGKHKSLQAKVAIEIARFIRLYGEDNVRFQLPMDMRPRMTNLYSTANLTGRILVEVSADTSINDIKANIKQQRAQNNEADVPHLFRYQFLNWIPQFIIRHKSNALAQQRKQNCRFRTSGEILNLGLIPVASYCAADLIANKVFFIPPEINTTALYVTLAGHPEGVDIIMRTPAYLDGGKLTQLLDFVVEGLNHHKAAEALAKAQG